MKIFFILIIFVFILGYSVNDSFGQYSVVTITTGQGSGAPGCEETSSCFVPFVARANIGDVIVMRNTDNTAHTFTSGTPSDGPDGVFDTSLLMTGSSFEWVSDIVGNQPYFCMIHPWMTGVIAIDSTYAPTDVLNFNEFSLEKEQYVTGEVVSIQGKILHDGETPVLIRIYDPRGSLVHIDQIQPDMNGYFLSNFRTGGSLKMSGMYSVTLDYRDLQGESSFNYLSTKENPSITFSEDYESKMQGKPEPTFDNTVSQIYERNNKKFYYNESFSFQVEYPSGWSINDKDDTEIVSFMDGPMECTSIAGIDCLWNSSIWIWKYSDMGEKLSDNEERDWQIDSKKTLCDDANMDVDEYTCRDFTVLEKLPMGKTLDGYPIMTTVFSVTMNYRDDLEGEFKQIVSSSLIYVDEDVWEIYSVTDSDVYSKYKDVIQNTINSFRHPASPPEITPSPSVTLPVIEEPKSNGGGCLIATATFDSELAPQVQKLREIRDSKLLYTESGSQFMEHFNSFYYSFSPYIADYERENPVFKEIVKIGITPMISTLSLMDYADTETEVLSIGISLIILNAMMYVGLPVFASMVIKKTRR